MQISTDIRTTMGVCKKIIGKMVGVSKLLVDAKNVVNEKADNGALMEFVYEVLIKCLA